MARLSTLLAIGSLTLLNIGTAQAVVGNAEAGKKIFAKCGTCHGIGDQKKPIAPNLNNVVGRTAGTLEDFKTKYSKAMVEAGAGGLVWDEAKLIQWVSAPKKMIPATKMVFPGLPKEQEAADVIAYVKTFSQ